MTIVLTLHFAKLRFYQYSEMKLKSAVRMPLKGWDLTENNNNQTYKLFSVSRIT